MNSHFYNRLMTGVILVGIGVLFLLDQLGILSEGISIGSIISTYWPVIIIVFSLKGVFFEKRLRYGWVGSYLWNLVALAVGIYFLSSNLGFINFSISDLIRFMLPILIIIFGLSMLFRPSPPKGTSKGKGRAGSDSNYRNFSEDNSKQKWSQESVLDERFPLMDDEELPQGLQDLPPVGKDDWKKVKEERKQSWKDQKHHWKEQRSFEKEQKHHSNGEHSHYGYTEYNETGKPKVEYRSGFIGDMYLGQDHWDLKPMNISHFIGDTKIDLSKANIPYGETRLEISAFIGDVKIFVPDDVDLRVSVTSSVFIGELNVMERYESGFAKSMKSESPQYQEAEKQLRVDVNLFLGDVVVKKVG